MEKTIGISGVASNLTHTIYDASKIKSYLNCPRDFFFTHVLGWKSEAPNINLIFGSAWLEAMELFMQQGLSTESVKDAYGKFKEVYEGTYPSYMEPPHAYKTPGIALEGLLKYSQDYYNDQFETLYTEVAGTAPIREDRIIHFKLDSIIRDSDGIWSMEHKTTGRKTQAWIDGWSIDTQVGLYHYALWLLFGGKEAVQGVKINGFIARKRDPEVIRIPVRRNLTQIEAHIGMVNRAVDNLETDMEILADTSPDHRTLVAFPENPNGYCGAYGCRFPMFCGVVPNPLQKCQEPPIGYKVEHWNPSDREKTAKKVVHLEKDDEA